MYFLAETKDMDLTLSLEQRGGGKETRRAKDFEDECRAHAQNLSSVLPG